ncbi:MAG TPA: tryptophan--tRNA ligase [Myxococcales bacterium]
MVRGPTTMTPQNAPKRVVSGMRPTGRLHLGHYHGAVKNWIDISRKAECFFFSADWHALTSEYKDTSRLAESQREMFADWIAAGLDPERCTLFIQSHVKQHAELFLLLGMIAPLGWLERVPTYKEQQEQLKEKDLNTYGFLGYPVLQTADVALYGADAVPVGQDQVSHLELAREIVRKFNHHYAGEKPVLVEPYPYLTDVPKILGLDGRKMSKSYGNAVELGEDPASARKRIMVAVTDPARVRRHDPGHPDVCPIYWLHRAYSPPEMVELVDRECRSAGIGCVDCKKMLLENLIPSLESHRAARAELDRHPGRIDELVQLGTRKAAAVAEETMIAVRDAVKLA